MKLGFMTSCLHGNLTEKLLFAASAGFKSIEICCWPKSSNDREYTGEDIDVVNISEKEILDIRNFCSSNDISISSLAYYENMLHADLNIRQKNLEHLKAVIVCASKLNVELVGTFVGKNIELTIEENFELFEEVFTDLLNFSESHNVKVMIENCPMPGWNREGFPSTISYSPELWEEMFKRIPSKTLGLNLDPSHLHWMQIDYLDRLDQFKERIFHVHAKDCVINKLGMNEFGIYGRQLNKKRNEDSEIFIAKVPGLGEINWKALILKLKEIGYGGTISIELEDEEFSSSDYRVKDGLVISKNILETIINYSEYEK